MRRRRRATSGCGCGRGRVGVVGETASSREMIGGRRCTGQERQTAAGVVVVMVVVVEVVSSVWREGRGGVVGRRAGEKESKVGVQPWGAGSG
jgi:hypothetical protein